MNAQGLLDEEISIKGYKCYRCNSETRRTGGVIIYIRNEIKCKIVNNKIIPGNTWMLTVLCEYKKWKKMVSVVYHSPSSSDAICIKEIEDIYEEIIVNNELIVMGDFNIDISKKTFYAKKIVEVMNNLGLKQKVSKFTRINEDSETIIDLVFSNIEIEVEVEYTPKITDHALVQIMAKMEHYKEDKYTVITYRDLSNANMERIRKEMRSISKNQELNNINIKEEINRKANWMVEEIVKEIKERDSLYKNAVKTKIREEFIRYKKKRNQIIKMVKSAKEEYIKNKLENNRGDTTKIWKILKEEFIGSKQTNRDNIGIKFTDGY